MTTPIDQRERDQLCDLFLQLGPDAPTLCEGWNTADLAAHLVLREHFHRWPKEAIAKEKAKGFEQLVGVLREGAPFVPWRIPGVRTLVNGFEYFVHHEDVRRANGLTPRANDADLDALTWRVTTFVGRKLARAVTPFGYALQTPDGRSRQFGPKRGAILSGPAPELALFLAGRRSAARVALSGDVNAILAVEASQSKM